MEMALRMASSKEVDSKNASKQPIPHHIASKQDLPCRLTGPVHHGVQNDGNYYLDLKIVAIRSVAKIAQT